MARVCISGYFDPLHIGHLEYIKLAKHIADFPPNAQVNEKKESGKKGTLIVIVNNDKQAALKKNKSFMPESERIAIIQALRYVDKVVLSHDTDRTVCATLASIKPPPDYFCNGGDATNTNIPEKAICDELGIKLLDGLGDKIQSSSWLTGLKKNA